MVSRCKCLKTGNLKLKLSEPNSCAISHLAGNFLILIFECISLLSVGSIAFVESILTLQNSICFF